MSRQAGYEAVLRAYGPECQPTRVAALGNASGFSGAAIWKLDSAKGILCLRRWPREHPTPARLDFIHGVLRHVAQGGFELLPLPIATREQATFVIQDGRLWELSPWMPGTADYEADPNSMKLESAMQALARFHLGSATFPSAEPLPTPSPGIGNRLRQLQAWLGGDLRTLAACLKRVAWPELEVQARRLLALVPGATLGLEERLHEAASWTVHLQPCLRDIWHDHVLFQQDRVSGLVDFGALDWEDVSADVARLLGSLAGVDQAAWQFGLRAYQSHNALSPRQLHLVEVFDACAPILSGLNWLRWVFLDERVFEDRPRVEARMARILERLEHVSRPE